MASTSRAITTMEAVATVSATNEFGDTTRVLCAADGRPETNDTVLDRLVPAKAAVIVRGPAHVAVRGLAARPLASVTPFGLARTSSPRLLEKATSWLGAALA